MTNLANATTAPMPELLTVSQAAAIIGVSDVQVTRYCRAGLLPAAKFGRDWQIAEADARAFIRPPVGAPTGNTNRKKKEGA